MALIGNRSVLHKSPGRFLAGTIASGDRSNFSKPGMRAGRFEAQSKIFGGLPSGHLSPSSWGLPRTAGAMSSINDAGLSLGTAGTAVMGVAAEGAASLTIDFALAAGELISSGEGAASFSLSLNAPLLTASLLAEGAASFAFTPTATMRADGELAGATSFSLAPSAAILPANDASPLRTATASFTITGSLAPYAIGSMVGSTASGGVLSEASIIAAMNASPPAVNIKKVNDVAVIGTGATGDEWRP